jgi:hypothetical protein
MKATPLSGLEDHVIPIVPTSTTYRVKISSKNGQSHQKTIRRTQFPMTASYSITDYHSQGQTILFVIVDIAPPPTGSRFPEVVVGIIERFS